MCPHSLECWKILEKGRRFQSALSLLGANWTISNDLLSTLEEYGCQLYGFRFKNIETVRYKLFAKKYTKENKIIDMAALPPCRSVLKLHPMRANTVAAIWKRSTSPIIELPQLSQCGWEEDSIRWVIGIFPKRHRGHLLI